MEPGKQLDSHFSNITHHALSLQTYTHVTCVLVALDLEWGNLFDLKMEIELPKVFPEYDNSRYLAF